MGNRIKKFKIGILFFLVFAVFLTVVLVKQRQDIRKRASTPLGTVTMSLSTVESNYFVGETIPVQVTFQTSSAVLSGFSLLITGDTNDFDFVSPTGGALSGSDIAFFVNPSFPNNSAWSTAINKSLIEGTIAKLKFAEFDLSTTGTIMTGSAMRGTFYVKPKRVPVSLQLALTPDIVDSKITDKNTGLDILRTPTVYTITIRNDTTPPTTPSVSDGGQFTSLASQLHASWTSSDAESGIVEYQYAIGTAIDTEPHRTDVVSWTSVGTGVEVTKTGLSLTSGTMYFFSVKAKDRLGNWSAVGFSDGIKVDTSIPTLPTVTDDGDTTVVTNQLHASWSSNDTQSGITEYKYAVGTGITTESERTNVVGWTSEGVNTSVTKTGLTLTLGTMYYFSVQARNGAGLWSDIGYSNGIRVIATTFSFGVKFQGIATANKTKVLTVTFRNGAISYPFDVTLTSGSGGVFSTPSTAPVTLTGVPTGQSYEILIKDKTQSGTTSRSNHLKKNMTKNPDLTITPFLISAGVNAAPATWTTDVSKILRAGDVNGDNVLTIDDINMIISKYTDFSVPVVDSPDPAVDTRNRDINSDNFITMEDISLTLTNYTDLTISGDN